jgi:AcrR family transcriptional regulator
LNTFQTEQFGLVAWAWNVKPRDCYSLLMEAAQETVRERILASAKTEIAQYGIAGARVERIAQRARTSKERLYAYFSSKRALFDEVIFSRNARLAQMAPLEADDLPGFVGRLFDFYTRDPEELRLHRWVALEENVGPLDLDHPRSARLREGIEKIAQAQSDGTVEASWPPLDLLNLLVMLAMGWQSAPVVAHQFASQAAGTQELASHRKSAVEAARRLVTPQGADDIKR